MKHISTNTFVVCDPMVYINPMKEISTKEACGVLGISRNTLYKWVELKKIKAKRVEVGRQSIRIFNYDDVRRIAIKFPKSRKSGFAVYAEKDLRIKKK